MNNSAQLRALLALVLVILPAIILFFYQSVLVPALDLPGAWSLLSQPITIFRESGIDEPSEKSLVSPVISKPVKIASGENTVPVSEPVIRQGVLIMNPDENTYQQSGAIKETLSEKSVETNQIEIRKNVESLNRKEKGGKLHAGIEQDGRLVPALTLKTDEDVIKHLLRKGHAFLVVTIENQRYLLCVTDQDNPFRDVVVGHLTNQSGLSERYLPLSRSQLQARALDWLDNQVAKRIRIRSAPFYSLVFSKEFNNRLIEAQLVKVKEEKINLSKIFSGGFSVSMDGQLTIMEESIDITFFSVKIKKR